MPRRSDPCLRRSACPAFRCCPCQTFRTHRLRPDLAYSAPTVCPTIPPLPDWPGLADETQDGQRANPLPGVRMVWRPDDFAAWPSGIDGSVAPGDLIQSQFGPAATITVTIAAEAELASLAPPTLPARPYARRTHFSRHDYQPFFANTPETYRGYRASPPGRTSPVMIFPTAIDVPLATSPSPFRPLISLNNHCHFPVFPARNAKTRKSA